MREGARWVRVTRSTRTPAPRARWFLRSGGARRQCAGDRWLTGRHARGRSVGAGHALNEDACSEGALVSPIWWSEAAGRGRPVADRAPCARALGGCGSRAQRGRLLRGRAGVSDVVERGGRARATGG